VTGEIGSPATGSAASFRIAGYQVEEQLGRGGMAVVYRALDVRLGRHVALKLLDPELARSDPFRRRFIHESRAAAAVDHAHIIPIFEAGEADGALFIVMRYVPTGDLRTLVEREGPLPPLRAAAITAQVASALDAAHAHGLVHRDVKPANLLIAKAGDGRTDHAYLSDFGLSKQALAPLGLTLTGQFLGTLDYVAPEQIEGRAVDGRADQYSLACATVEMLTGAPPFQRDQNMALMWAQLSAAPPPLTERRPGLPPAIDRVFARALAKSPDDRYPTCTAFATAMRAACAPPAAGQEGPGPARPSWAEPTMQAGPGRMAPAHGPPRRSGPPPAPRSRDAAVPGDPTGQARLPRLSPGGPDPARHAPPRQSPARQTPSRQTPSRQTPSRQTPSRQAPSRQAPPSAAPPSAAPARADPSNPDSWDLAPLGQALPPRSGSPPPGTARRPPGRPRQRRRLAVLTAIMLLVAVLAVAEIAHKLLHKPATTAAAAVAHGRPAALAARHRSPAGTVRAYFAAISRHDYAGAWKLGGRDTGQSYSAFVSGYQGTARDAVTILSTSGRVVTARLTATQTDGSIRTYQGTYTVTSGVITSSDVSRTS